MTDEDAARRRAASVFSATPLLLIVLLGVALRCISLDAPLTDTHSQRQIDVASMARYFAEDSMNPLQPQVNWGGRRGYVESEFPLVPWTAAVLYKMFGASDMWGRLLSVLFSAGAIWMMCKVGEALIGPAAGRAAAFVLAISPSAVYYGRAFMPEAALLCFGLAGLYQFVRYFQTGEPRTAWLGGALTGLAWLVKLTGAITLAPIVAAGWLAKRWGLLRDRRFILALAAAVVVVVAWYAHSSAIYDRTGLSVGLHPPKSYPPSIGPGPWRERVSKWDPTLLTDRTFYQSVFEYIFFTHLTPIGFVLAALGTVLWRRPQRFVAAMWSLAMAVFIFATPLVNRWHDYYQILIVPIAALFIGWVIAPPFDGAWLRQHAGRAGGVAITLLLGGLGVLTFWSSGILESHFQARPGAVEASDAGRALAEIAQPDELAIVVDGFGVNSPMLLYFAHMRGWSFDTVSLTPDVVQRLYERGARYVMTTRLEELQHDNAGLVEFLRGYAEAPLKNPRRDTVVFDLTKRR